MKRPEYGEAASRQKPGKKGVRDYLPDEEFRAIYYQYELHLKLNALMEQDNMPEVLRDEYYREALKKISYLNYDNMMSLEEAKKKIRAYFS